MSNDTPRGGPPRGDSIRFAKLLAELKKDLRPGEDPLYHDMGRGGRRLTREERYELRERARARVAAQAWRETIDMEAAKGEPSLDVQVNAMDAPPSPLPIANDLEAADRPHPIGSPSDRVRRIRVLVAFGLTALVFVSILLVLIARSHESVTARPPLVPPSPAPGSTATQSTFVQQTLPPLETSSGSDFPSAKTAASPQRREGASAFPRHDGSRKLTATPPTTQPTSSVPPSSNSPEFRRPEANSPVYARPSENPPYPAASTHF